MRLMTKSYITPALLALALSLPAAAWAQTTTAPATTQPAASIQQKVEQRIADMHATLNITPAQETQWDAFAQVMLDNAQAMQALESKSAGNMATASAVELLQSYSEIAQQHAQNVQKLSTAFGTLYASLTAEQKKSADEMFRSTAERREEKKSSG
jgi:protein CpxP